MTIRSFMGRPVRAALAASTVAMLALAAGCSPKYNWRDYASPDARYHVLFPARPSTVTRTIHLDTLPVTMTMTAARVDGTTFAVGAADTPDTASAQAALAAMQTALVRNIGAQVTREKAAAASSNGESRAVRDVDASGAQDGAPMRLVGHFEARGTRIYQVVVLGKPDAMPAEQVEQFLSSFKLP
jgi:hypothetical protein